VVDPIRDPTGKLIGFGKITRDLSERKEAEEKLWHTQKLFRLLVQGVTDYAIYLLDTQGNIVSWNAGAERIKGYQAHEIVGQHFSRFYAQEDAAAGAPMEALATALREGKFEREGPRRRKDGSSFWAHVVIDPVYDADAGGLPFRAPSRRHRPLRSRDPACGRRPAGAARRGPRGSEYARLVGRRLCPDFRDGHQ
jgi:PAS domain S-box-containing protein